MYFSRPARRCGAKQIHLDTLEMWLLAWIEEKTNHNTTSSTRQKSTYTNEEVNRIADSVPEVVTVLLQHPSPLILKHESEWLTQELAEYRTLPKDVATRRQWVKKKLHRLSPKHAYGLLGGLLRVTRCPRLECSRRTTVPDRDELDTWTERSGSGVRTLTFHILAHYHGSTYGTVKRLLQSCSSR